MELLLDNRLQHSFNIWYHEILIKSGKFSVKYDRMPEHDRMLEIDKIVYPGGRLPRHGQISFARLGGKLIVFDTQFDDKFTIKYLNNGLLSGVDASVYVKYKKNIDVQKLLNCKLMIWAMFPASWYLVDKFKYNSFNSNYNVMASGRNSLRVMKRVEWFERAKSIGIDTHLAINHNVYLELLKKSRYGIILSIRNEKNTREYEFISNEMPLALNYNPEFEFSFVPNEHYLFIKNLDDLNRVLTEDPTKYHKHSKFIWENYFRPDVATDIMIKKINEIPISMKIINSYNINKI